MNKKMLIILGLVLVVVILTPVLIIKSVGNKEELSIGKHQPKIDKTTVISKDKELLLGKDVEENEDENESLDNENNENEEDVNGNEDEDKKPNGEDVSVDNETSVSDTVGEKSSGTPVAGGGNNTGGSTGGNNSGGNTGGNTGGGSNDSGNTKPSNPKPSKPADPKPKDPPKPKPKNPEPKDPPKSEDPEPTKPEPKDPEPPKPDPATPAEMVKKLEQFYGSRGISYEAYDDGFFGVSKHHHDYIWHTIDFKNRAARVGLPVEIELQEESFVIFSQAMNQTVGGFSKSYFDDFWGNPSIKRGKFTISIAGDALLITW